MIVWLHTSKKKNSMILVMNKSYNDSKGCAMLMKFSLNIVVFVRILLLSGGKLKFGCFYLLLAARLSLMTSQIGLEFNVIIGCQPSLFDSPS